MGETPNLGYEHNEHISEAAVRFVDLVEAKIAERGEAEWGTWYDLKPSGLSFSEGVSFISTVDDSNPDVKYVSARFFSEGEPYYKVTAFDGRNDQEEHAIPSLYVMAGEIENDGESGRYGGDLSEERINSLVDALETDMVVASKEESHSSNTGGEHSGPVDPETGGPYHVAATAMHTTVQEAGDGKPPMPDQSSI